MAFSGFDAQDAEDEWHAMGRPTLEELEAADPGDLPMTWDGNEWVSPGEQAPL